MATSDRPKTKEQAQDEFFILLLIVATQLHLLSCNWVATKSVLILDAAGYPVKLAAHFLFQGCCNQLQRQGV